MSCCFFFAGVGGKGGSIVVSKKGEPHCPLLGVGPVTVANEGL